MGFALRFYYFEKFKLILFPIVMNKLIVLSTTPNDMSPIMAVVL